MIFYHPQLVSHYVEASSLRTPLSLSEHQNAQFIIYLAVRKSGIICLMDLHLQILLEIVLALHRKTHDLSEFFPHPTLI